MILIKILYLVSAFAATTKAFKPTWTWWDLRDLELQLHLPESFGRVAAGEKTSTLESSQYCMDAMKCLEYGYYFDLQTLHCYKAKQNGSRCYNLGGEELIGEYGYRFQKDKKLGSLLGRGLISDVLGIVDDVEKAIVNQITDVEEGLENILTGSLTTHNSIKTHLTGDIGVYQTANSLYGSRKLVFKDTGTYLIRLMFALVNEFVSYKTRRFNILLSGNGTNATLKRNVNIYEASGGFYNAYDVFSTVHFNSKSQQVLVGKNIVKSKSNTTKISFEPISNDKDYMNGYCRIFFHRCTRYCNNQAQCNKQQKCRYDQKNGHCVEKSTACDQNSDDHFECNKLANCFYDYINSVCVNEDKKEEDCSGIPKLQIALVVDNSMDPDNKFYDGKDGFNLILSHIDKIKSLYNDPEFAITTFAGWGTKVWGQREFDHEEETGCYQLLQPFTADVDKIKQAKVKFLPNVHKSNGPTALAWTAVDKNIGWRGGSYILGENGESRPLVRLMLISDHLPFHETLDGTEKRKRELEGSGHGKGVIRKGKKKNRHTTTTTKRPKPKFPNFGNRKESSTLSNTCQLNKPASLNFVYDVLKTQNVSVIGVLDSINSNFYNTNFKYDRFKPFDEGDYDHTVLRIYEFAKEDSDVDIHCLIRLHPCSQYSGDAEKCNQIPGC
ncbi:hypothetical protein Ocin01_09772, partial [Orchesella cincta]